MKKSSQELVSIVVPVFNAARFLDEMLESVKSQTYPHWELIFIDDGSSDDSAAIIKERQKSDTRIKLFAMKVNSGAAKARNRGVSKSSGRYIAFLDADDLWHPKKLEKQIGFMQRKEGAFSFTGYEFAEENGKPNGKRVIVPSEVSYRQAMKRSSIWTTTVIVDLEKVKKHDILMPSYPIGEDAATWWGLLRKYGNAQAVTEVLAYYRRHGDGSLSSNKLKAVLWRWRLYRKHEKLSLILSLYYFYHYAIYAVSRRV